MTLQDWITTYSDLLADEKLRTLGGVNIAAVPYMVLYGNTMSDFAWYALHNLSDAKVVMEQSYQSSWGVRLERIRR